MWRSGGISNYEYLNYVNILANRSHNNLSQYPIFPWIIHDYTADVFDVNDTSLFRDLTKPIGAINKHRLQKLKDLYEMQKNRQFEDDDELEQFQSRCHIYPTHYSMPGFVTYFLIRKIP